MGERYGRKDAERAFELLAFVCGARIARRFDDHGAWQLDHNATYGGYVVHQICDDSSGVSEPFGSMRRTAREFCQAANFAVRAIERANLS